MSKDTWFKARYNWSEVFNDLTDKELRILILAIWHYAKDCTEPENLSHELKLAWRLIKGELEQDIYYRDCGKRGGNPLLKAHAVSTGVEGWLNGGSIEEIDKNREEKKKEERREEKDNIANLSLSPKRAVKFSPPSVEEVAIYCQERNNGINAEQFVDYYAARGWELKQGQKMKDWKAAVRTWEQNRKGWNDDVHRTVEKNRVRGQRDLYGL